jgi:hypothetical protein
MKRITLFSTLKLIIPISIFQLLTSQLFAGTSYTWTGMASKDWATALNWSPSGVPSSGDNVTIPSTTNQL